MMNPFSNPSYLLPPLIGAFVTILLLVLIWQKGRRDFSSRIFSCLLLSVGLWALFVFGMRSSSDIHQAALWARLIVPIAYAIFVFYYHFSLAYTGARGQRGILLVSYLLLVIAAGLIFTRLLVDRMALEDYGYAPMMGTIGLPIVIIAMLLVGGGTYNLLRRYKVSHSYEERNRLLYLVIASLFPLIGGVLDGFSDLPPAAIWTNLIFCIICSIAILKYHLLDIRIVVRKSLVYLLVSSGIAIPYVSLLHLLHYIFKPAVGPWWIHALIILLLAIILRPLYSSSQQIVDRLFYRDRYDYLRALEQFSREAQSIVKLKELSTNITQLVSGALRTSCVCLLLPSEDEAGFVVVHSTGWESLPSGIVLRKNSPVIKWLELHKDILSSKQLEVIPQLQTLMLKEKDNLERMGAKLLVPIKTRQGQLSGILVLGPKLSLQSYSGEDRQLLTTVSNQMAMALENARLYEQTRESVKALRESEEFNSSLLNNSPHPIIVVNSDTSIRYVNPALEQLIGFSSAEVIGCKAPYPWWTEETLPKTSRDFEEAIHQGAKGLEELFQKKDGELFWVEITSKPVMQNEEFMYYLSSWIDVTERKRAEDALRESEEKLERVFQSVSDGITVTDLNGIITDVNERALQLSGFGSKSDLVGKISLESIAPRDQERALRDMQELSLNMTVGSSEYTLLRADGSEYPAEVSAGVLKDTDGNLNGFVSVIRDITKRKQAEEELVRLSNAVRMSTDSIVISNLEAKIIDVNEATLKMYGTDNKDELIGKSAFALIAPEEREKAVAYMNEVMEKGYVNNIEYHVVTRNGIKIPVEMSASIMKGVDDKPIGFVGVTRDITERKRAEEREKKLQQELYLSSRLASIGELAAGVAHEINNPLTGVLGFSQRLLRKSTDEEVSRGLEIIHNEALRAAKVVENLLTFARHHEPKKEYLDINEILQKTLELRAYELETSNIEVVTDFAPSLPKTIADFQQMEEVFLNVIVNAEQTMSETNRGGRLTIKTHEITDYIRVSFTDSGPGIAPEHLDNLFDPFFTTREGKSGTGLGLSICHGIVTEHGGRIYARSKPGEGATFVVELPVITEEAVKSRIIKE